MSRIIRTGGRAAIAALTLVATTALAACGSDDDGGGGSSSATTTVSPESVIVPDATVTKGLADTIAKMKVLATDVGAAKAQSDDVQNMWYSYEGTIKQNEVQDYLDFEDALGSFRTAAKDGDTTAMDAAVTAFQTTATTYLAKHPG
jgi:hypothetical protein